MKKLFMLSLFSICSLAGQADVRVFQYEEGTVPVAKYEEGHIVQKCDSQRTKRRAHMFSANNLHKRLDNEMINGSYKYCISSYQESSVSGELKPVYDPQCVNNARLMEREQREAGRRGIVQGLGSVGAFIFGLSKL